MSDSATDLPDRLAARPLPVLDADRGHMLAMLEEENWSMSDYARVIRRDPGFVARIIGMANERQASRGREPLHSTETAVSLLGKGPFADTVTEAATLDGQVGEATHRQGFRATVARALMSARLAEAMARERGSGEPEAAYLSGMLHHLPELALWAVEGESMRAVYTRIQDTGEHLEHAAEDVLATSLNRIGTTLAEAWHLPELVGLSFADPNATAQSPSRGIRLAAHVARESEFGWYHDGMDQCVTDTAAFIGGEPQEAATLLQAAALATLDDARTLGVVPTAAFLPLIGHQRVPVDPDLCLPRAGPRTGRASGGAETDPVRRHYQSAFKRLAAEIREQTRPMNRVMHDIFKSLHRDLDLSRVCFASFTPDRQELVARIVLDSNPESRLRGMRIKTEPPNLFSVLSRKPQGLWINEGNLDRYWPVIPANIKHRLTSREFFVFSIHADDRSLGVVYADRFGIDAPLDATTYEFFRRYCRLMIRELGQG